MFGFGPNDSGTQKYERGYESARKARLPFDRNILLNTAFFLNHQYAEWVPTAGTIRTAPLPKDANGLEFEVPRPVSNKIQHFVLQEHSMALNTRPTPDVLPANNDPMAISNAQALDGYLEWLASEQVGDFDAVLAMATLWSLAAGEGWIKWGWDPSAKTGSGRGRGYFSAPSPLEIYPDPYAASMTEARYVYHRRFMDVEKIYDIFNVRVQPQPMSAADETAATLMSEMGMTSLLEGATVTEYWRKPDRTYPKGLFCAWSGNTWLVTPTDFPFEHEQLPFTQIGSIQRPGQLHTTCAVETMRPEQIELNNYHAQSILIMRYHANPKWWVPEEVQLQSMPNDKPNQILRGSAQGGFKPELIAPPINPTSDAMGQWLKNEMMDTVGVHEVSQAQVPGRVEAAAAIELLKESDNGRLAELTRTTKRAIAIGFYQQAMLLRQFGSPETSYVTYSTDGYPEMKALFTADIDPGINIRVTMQGGIGQSRAAREDRWMNMWSQGIITDPHVMAELMDVPISTISPDNSFDIRQQRNENLIMAAGNFIQPQSWENHEIHLRELNNYRKTAEYRKSTVRVKQMLEAHAEMHQTLWIQQMGKQLQQQQLAAAVAAGAGFGQPVPPTPGALVSAGGAPAPAGQQSPGQYAGPTAPGQPQQSGGPTQAPTPAVPGPPTAGPPPTPNAFGAQPPVDPYAVRDSPQYQATTRQRTAAAMAGTGTSSLHR